MKQLASPSFTVFREPRAGSASGLSRSLVIYPLNTEAVDGAGLADPDRALQGLRSQRRPLDGVRAGFGSGSERSGRKQVTGLPKLRTAG